MDAQEQLCYIPCSFCSIVLAVSVPCNNLFDVVTIRCGHCTNLWSVNMAAAAYQYLQQQIHQQGQNATANIPPTYTNAFQGPYQKSSEYNFDISSSSKWNNNKMQTVNYSKPEPKILNHPREKRQRVPSAYNQFIKEEIQRIKANNPDISHREAFSTAAKNWAHFPHIHFGLMLQSNNRV